MSQKTFQCSFCHDFIELDSSQCTLCKSLFCYTCLLKREDRDLHSRSKLNDACSISVGELKRNKLDF